MFFNNVAEFMGKHARKLGLAYEYRLTGYGELTPFLAQGPR
jgi:hypothetical protein